MKSSIISTTSDSISSGGTVTGDLTVEGDFVVEGGGSLTVDSATSGVVTIDSKTNTPCNLTLTAWSTNEGKGSNLNLRHSNNNTVGTETALDSGDDLGAITFQGYDAAADWDNGAIILAEASGTFSTSASPTNLKFFTGSGSAGGIDISSATPNLILDSNSRISLGNNDSGGDSSNTIFGYLAGDKIISGGLRNTLIGFQTGNQTTYGITTGDDNTAVGNGAIGASAGSNITGSNNTGIGSRALYEIEGAGANNTAIGMNSLLNLNTGADNTAVGVGAGDAITTTTECTLVGKNAGGAINSADAAGTTAIGHTAGAALADGQYNSYVGFESGAVSTGDGNAYFGWRAGKGASGADSNNVGIGYNALLAITSGTNNVIIGRNAGDSMTTLNECVFIGDSSGAATTVTGGSNVHDGTVAVGFQSLNQLTSGVGNVAIGYMALKTTSANGDGNTAVGYKALEDMDADVDGHGYNTAIGYAACLNLSTGAGNTAIGAGSLGTAAIAGDNNIAVGNNTGRSITSGTDNIIVGKGAGEQLTTAQRTVIIGSLAGDAVMITNGSGSVPSYADGTVAIGYSALGALTSGSANVAIGYTAGTEEVSSIGNTIIGHEALYRGGGHANYRNTFVGHTCGNGDWGGASSYNTGIGSGVLQGTMNGADHNVAVGLEACNAITSGDRNVGLGNYAGNSITTGSYNTLIGFDVDTDAADQSYQTVLGYANVFKMLSKQYVCDFCKNDDGDTASSDSAPLKLPANSIIKSISVMVTQLSDLDDFNVALVHSTSSGAVSDDSAPAGTPIEILGAGGSPDTAKRGSDGDSTDIDLSEPAGGGGSGTGIVKQSYYNGFNGNGLHIGTAARYIHVVNASGNGDSNPSTDGYISVLVEYVGLD